MKKKYKLKSGFMVILYGPIFIILGNVYLNFMDIEKNKLVSQMTEVEIWSYIVALAVISGISVVVSISSVNIIVALYQKITGKSGKGPDYF